MFLLDDGVRVYTCTNFRIQPNFNVMFAAQQNKLPTPSWLTRATRGKNEFRCKRCVQYTHVYIAHILRFSQLFNWILSDRNRNTIANNQSIATSSTSYGFVFLRNSHLIIGSIALSIDYQRTQFVFIITNYDKAKMIYYYIIPRERVSRRSVRRFDCCFCFLQISIFKYLKCFFTFFVLLKSNWVVDRLIGFSVRASPAAFRSIFQTKMQLSFIIQ